MEAQRGVATPQKARDKTNQKSMKKESENCNHEGHEEPEVRTHTRPASFALFVSFVVNQATKMHSGEVLRRIRIYLNKINNTYDLGLNI